MKFFSIKSIIYIFILSSICIMIKIWKERDMDNFGTSLPPKAPLKQHSYEVNGVKVEDPFAWLRDPQWKSPEDGVKDLEILEYIKSENTYSDAFFKPLQPIIKEIFEERRGFLPKVDESVPLKKGDYYYYRRQQLDQNYPVFLRKKKTLQADEEVILDVNQEALKFSFFKLGGMSISPSQQYMAYSTDTSGKEFFDLKVRDLITKTDLEDVIPNVAGSVVWKTDNSGFYYLQYSSEWRPKKMFLHLLGSNFKEDQLIYEEKDDLATLSLDRTTDRRYLILHAGTKDENSVHVIDLFSEVSDLILLLARLPKRLIYSTEHYRGKFYHLTNDKGPNFRLIGHSLNASEIEEIYPHHPSVYLTSLMVCEKGLTLTTKEAGLNKIGYFDLEKRQLNYLSFPGESYDLSLIPTPYENNEVRFSYSALNKPLTVYGCSYGNTELTTLKVQEISSGFQEDLYECKRVWVTAKDGVKIPLSLAYRKDLFIKGQPNPVLLYGYGSYGYGMDAGFHYSAISMMNRGFIYAIAHIRGGDELGFQWYLDGKMLNKKNTFQDFIDCAEYLIHEKYTTVGNIAAMGGSAGGMLMGVIANERPELFKAIIAHVPFVDVLNTMLDETLPLTPGEFVEWGNPKDSKYFNYILSYSPYDNVKKQAYPALYITGGITDPRVTYWEPAKWVAKLRHYHTGTQPILLKIRMGAGHAGGSKRDERLWEDAEDLAFLLKIYGRDN